MSLTSGTRLGMYEVLGPIGAGGMGEVYRARDGKLNRDVAVKVLSDLLGRDPERLARFEREAQVLASINHPNIAAIYGVEDSAGSPALILELVEGPTLADRLASGPLALDEALSVARQIAEALEAAHALGVVHRDLKPANIKLRTDGTVKVLDFGLAKAFGPGGPSPDPMLSPTFTAATAAGVVLGTAAYMAPEQARGRPVDKRADIWAFGCVLFECLTGRQAFGGETASDIVAAILTRDIDLAALPTSTPRRVRDLLRRCLQRDPRRRLHDIADARIEITEVVEQPDDAVAAVPATTAAARTPQRARRLPWVLVAVLSVAAAALGWLYLRVPAAVSPPAARVAINLPDGFALDTDWPIVAISPDGTRLVVVGLVDGVSQLYLRRIDREELTPLAGTRGATRPFFSPDGEWVAFTAAATLKKVSLEGGPAVSLCPAAWGGGTWGRDGRIIFTQDYNAGLWSVPAGGGTPQLVTAPDKKAKELGHWWPQLLPDGDTVIFTSLATPIEASRIVARSLKTGQQKVVVQGAVFGRYMRSAHLLFARGDTVLVAPFDLRRLEVSGGAVPLAEGVLLTPQNAASQLAVSDAGIIAMIMRASVSTTHRLVSIDRKGAVRVVREHLRTFGGLRVSPDGHRIALGVIDGSKPVDVWVQDLDRGSLTRLTIGPASNFNPVWTPDGKRIVYASERPVFELYSKSADGESGELLLATTAQDKYPSAITPDASMVLSTTTTTEHGEDVWGFPLSGHGEPQAVVITPASDQAGRLSPDGRWVAFSSDAADPGGKYDVYVRPFPAGDARYQVSADGGTEPVWGPGGRELFYLAGRRLMSAPIAADGRPGTPAPLLDVTFKNCQSTVRTACYDVAPDGQRFYALEPEQPARSQPSVELLLNAFTELKRIAPR